MPAFNGTLNSNEIFSALYNMIISQQVFADNLKGGNAKLVNAAKVDGTLYGDTKLYYSTDCLASYDWTNDGEAANLLALDRPEAPKVQAITLDKFRQIRLTVDNYLSKRAWADEGSFSSFNSVMLQWIKDTKKVYDETLYNAYIGTTNGASNAATKNITIASGTSDEDEAKLIAKGIADLLVDMNDVSRDFNDYEQLRSYDTSEVKVIWNSEFVNKIKKIDLPTIFHKDGLVDKFEEYTLPKRYFGNVGTDAITKANNNGTYRSMIEADYATAVGQACIHVFPGDLIPQGTARVTAKNEDKTAKTITSGIAANAYYTEDATIIAKVYTKLPPYMSAFEVGTSFFNPRSLTENHYLTFGHNTIEYLKAYPLVTIKKA